MFEWQRSQSAQVEAFQDPSQKPSTEQMFTVYSFSNFLSAISEPNVLLFEHRVFASGFIYRWEHRSRCSFRRKIWWKISHDLLCQTSRKI